MMSHPDTHLKEKAPSFTLPDPDGQPVRLEDLLGKGPVVLFFVPRPPTGVCARTARGLRDHHAELEAVGAQVVGISPMRKEVHAQLCEQHRLPFVYLEDQDAEVAKAYGVRPFAGLIPGRATFVLDREGTIVWAERSPVAAGKHVEGAVTAVKRLQAE